MKSSCVKIFVDEGIYEIILTTKFSWSAVYIISLWYAHDVPLVLCSPLTTDTSVTWQCYQLTAEVHTWDTCLIIRPVQVHTVCMCIFIIIILYSWKLFLGGEGRIFLHIWTGLNPRNFFTMIWVYFSHRIIIIIVFTIHHKI